MRENVDFDELTPAEQRRLRGLLAGDGRNVADPYLALRAIKQARRRNASKVLGAVGAITVLVVGIAAIRDGSDVATPSRPLPASSVLPSPSASSSPSSEPDASPSASSPEATAPSSSPTFMTTSEARDAYLAAYCPGSAMSDSVYHVLLGKTPATVSRARLHETAVQAVAAYRQSYLKLTEPPLPWPSEIQDDITRIAKDNLIVADHYQRLADAGSGAEIMALADNWPIATAKVQQSVAHMREALGLPPQGGCRI